MNSAWSHLGTHAELWKKFAAVGTAIAMLMAMFVVMGGQGAPTNQTLELRINSLESPVGVPLEGFSMGWQTSSTVRGTVQDSYQITVAESESQLADSPVWTTGRVHSRDQFGITYAGSRLEPATKYFWQVKTWSGPGEIAVSSDPATFDTQLDPAKPWPAEWIGGLEHTDPIDRWADYTTTAQFSVQSGGLGLYLRSASLKDGYLWQLGVVAGKTIFRPQVKQAGVVRELDSKDISLIISPAQLLAGRHTLTAVVKGADLVTLLDGVEIDRRRDDTFSKGYVGFYQTSTGEGKQNATVYSVKVESGTTGMLLDTVFAENSNPFTSGRSAAGKLVLLAPTDALYRSLSGMPMLRTEFDIDKPVSSARLYATARGIYETSLNGKKVGDEWLAPGWTDYKTAIQYQSFDVTGMVEQGGNAWGAMLADGWYAGNIAALGTGHYGETPSFLGQLRIDYTDGTHQIFGTNNSWKTVPGPVVQGDLIMGETYDAGAEMPGWTGNNFDDSSWLPVRMASPSTAALVPQTDQPVRQTDALAARSRTEPKPGMWIYDLGQNMVGVGSVTVQGRKGERLRVRYGETLASDGTLYTANLRSAIATDDYIFAEDGTKTFEPKFTSHGFRYMEVSGVAEGPSTQQVRAIVLGSDLPQRGTFSTSSDMLNQLQSNIMWSQRGNFLSIPTDTPARDERLGWTADVNAFAATASHNQDAQAFLGKWLKDVRETQLDNGDFPGVAPSVCACFEGGTGWSDAIVTVPYALWQSFGDTAVLRENYQAMKRFMEFQVNTSGSGHIRISGGYGDWLNLDDPTDPGLLGTAYFAYTAGLMAEMAQELGNVEDAQHYSQLAASVRNAFIFNYVGGDGSVVGGSQTGYALAIGMSLVPEELRAQAGVKLSEAIAARGGHLSTGFLGTPWLLKALSGTGHIDLAFALLTSTSYPSWGYEIGKGATTLWERWDGIRPDGSFQDPTMNSFNHFAPGAVGEWMYANIGGIRATKPGFREFEIRPRIGGGVTHADTTLESPYGTIRSSWALTEEALNVDVSVPTNAEATVLLPVQALDALMESGRPVVTAEGVLSVQVVDGTATLIVGSGDYRFSVAAGR